MPRKKNFKEDEVLQKAILLFWEKGFNATSMDDLVHTLGINRASMYDTFGSKEGLFTKAFEQYKAQEKESMIQFFRQQSGVKDGLYKLFERTIDKALSTTAAKGCFVVNTTTELLPGNEVQKAAVLAYQNEIEELFSEFIDWGKSRNEVPGDKNTAALSRLFYLLYNGLQVLVKSNPNKEILMPAIAVSLTALD